jgi:hypothetical protein
MADSFSGDQVQGVFGELVPVLDSTVSFTADQVQGVFGELVPVLDEAAGAVAVTGPPAGSLALMGVGK